MRILQLLTLSMLILALNVQAKVYEVKKESDIKKTGYSVVKFYAEWCGPCKMFKSTFEELADKHANKAEFYSVNADEQSGILEKYGVKSLPTIAILLDNKLVEKVGANELAAKLEALKAPSKEVAVVTQEETPKVASTKTTTPKMTSKVTRKVTKKEKKSCSDCNCDSKD